MKSKLQPNGNLIVVREIGKKQYEWFPIRAKICSKYKSRIYEQGILSLTEVCMPSSYIGKRVQVRIEFLDLPTEQPPIKASPFRRRRRKSGEVHLNGKEVVWNLTI